MCCPWGIEATDVGVRHGRIAALGVAADATADEVIDARGLHVLPGLIDPHVHLRDPGDKAVETIPTGTRAAVLGGLAAVFDMPNTAPSIVDADRLAWKQDYVEREAWCDIGLYVGGTKQNIPRAGGAGTGPWRVRHQDLRRQLHRRPAGGGRRDLERVMRSGRRRIAYHSEDEYRLQDRKHLFRVGRSVSPAHGMARRGDGVPGHAGG